VLYSCAATACRDALAHAQPQRLWLSVHRRGADVVLVVGNDGVGFGARPATGERDGLGDLAETVERAGGVLELTTLPDEGTVLAVSLPVERNRSRALWNRLRGSRAEDDSPVVLV
jgi:signal transduction histidine kinase